VEEFELVEVDEEALSLSLSRNEIWQNEVRPPNISRELMSLVKQFFLSFMSSL
jgi:hypothetical protein